MTPSTRARITETYYALWATHRIAPRVDDVVAATGLPRGMAWAWLLWVL